MRTDWQAAAIAERGADEPKVPPARRADVTLSGRRMSVFANLAGFRVEKSEGRLGGLTASVEDFSVHWFASGWVLRR